MGKFRDDVGGLDVRSARRRLQLYDLLDTHPDPRLDGSGHPVEQWVVLESGVSLQQLRNTLAATAHPGLGAGHRFGMVRLVWEAKCWTFEPHHVGWQVQQELLRLPARLCAETYLAVCAQWAIAHPRLAVMGHRGDRLPQLAQNTMHDIAAAGGVAVEDNERLLLGCGERLIDQLLDPTVDREVIALLNAVRGDLASVQFGDVVGDEVLKLESAIGRFMRLAGDAEADARPAATRALVAMRAAISVITNRFGLKDVTND